MGSILSRNEPSDKPGTVQFVENGKMRFALNPASAQRAGLRISSKLLALAKVVKDETAVIP
jgi:YfiR/HmsC-like